MKTKTISLLSVSALAIFAAGGRSLFEYVHRRDSSSLKSNPPQFDKNNLAVAKAQQFSQLSTQQIQQVAFDGWTLTGFLAKNPQNKGTVLIVHGFGVDHHSLDKIGAIFYELGYNVLQPDNRAAGASQGRYLSYGYLEKYDVQTWLNWLVRQKQLNQHLILFGASMGAATVLQSLELSLPKNLRGVIADSSYTNALDIMNYNVQRQIHVYGQLVTPMISLWSKILLGSSYHQINPLKAVESNHLPLLLIRGLKDTTVPPQMTQQIYDAANGAKKLASFATGAHIRSVEAEPKRYYQMIADFCAQT